MYSRTILLSVRVAIAEARFGQEQIPISAISSAPGGSSGQAQTLAGQSISTLLGAANPCAKLTQADLILSELGDGALEAAIGLVAAEQNFNNFNVDIPSICSDPTLPTSEALRGITPLIDPGVLGSDIANALSASSKTAPLNAVGLSVAEVLVANGFSNFTAEDESLRFKLLQTSAKSSSTFSSNAAVGTDAVSGSVTGTFTGLVASSIAGLDFARFDGRKAAEFPFQAQDPLVNKSQGEALNPTIIAKRICDQLTNVCKANDAAKTACTAALVALGGRVAQTANDWNTQLEFAGTNLNPDNAPQSGLVGYD
ncbi:hypothetical protein F5882DRAFT_454873 [Hyaloscypha sp. PMI_1271]|nr:hypothetical protein F5882DRAFT_454873 [Hyaloscypha sp. PMI_1271]